MVQSSNWCRYVISVAVITFAYSMLQLAVHLYQFATGKPAIRRPLSLYIDFACDQAISLLLPLTGILYIHSLESCHVFLWKSFCCLNLHGFYLCP